LTNIGLHFAAAKTMDRSKGRSKIEVITLKAYAKAAVKTSTRDLIDVPDEKEVPESDDGRLDYTVYYAPRRNAYYVTTGMNRQYFHHLQEALSYRYCMEKHILDAEAPCRTCKKIILG
jgi:hypothetical protein